MDPIKNLTCAIEREGRFSSVYHVFTDFLEAALEDFGVPLPRDRSKRSDIDPGPLVQLYRRAVFETPPLRDVLGPVYMELASRGYASQMGQFFTPWEIASLMVQIQVGAQALPASPGRLIKIHDPACGSGVLLLAALDHVRKVHGADALEQFSVTGVDIDWLCARMAALQFAANNAIHNLRFGEVIVIHGDSLGLREFATVLHATARPI